MKKSILLFFAILLFAHYNVNGQTKPEMEHLKKTYSGTWVNKKDKRYLQIYFDEEVDYVTINDWTGSLSRNKSKTLDAYKAFIKGDKLIMPSENDDHHCPYCEITVVNEKLIYECNGISNFTNNKLVKSQHSNQTIFERLRK